MHWILHIRISLNTKFQLKVTILLFWTKFAQKVHFLCKTEKVTTDFCIFALVLVPNFPLNWQFWFFGLIFFQKAYFWSTGKLKKWRRPLNFEPLNQKQVLPGKSRKKEMTIELYIFQLVLVPSFNLNRQFWFFGPNLSKKGISCLKQKKVNSTTRLCIFNLVLVPNFSLKLVSAIFYQIFIYHQMIAL